MSEVFWSAFGGGIAGGMVAALVALAVEWGKQICSKPHLKVSGTVRYIVIPGTTSNLIGINNDAESQFILTAANDRQYPITVTGFGIRLKGGNTSGLFLIPNKGFQLPYEILPGHNLTQWTSVPDLAMELKNIGKEPRDLRYIWFKTATNQEFRGPIDRGAMGTMREEYNKHTG